MNLYASCGSKKDILMKPSSTACRQKEMNRTRMTQIERINADLFIKINNPLKFSFTNRSK